MSIVEHNRTKQVTLSGQRASPEALIEEARTRYRRRRRRIATLVLALAAAIGAGAWFAAGFFGGGLTAKQIESRMVAAQADDGRFVVFERDQPTLANIAFPPGFKISGCLGCGLTKRWIDLKTGERRDLYYSPAGALISQQTMTLLHHGQLTSGQVDYRKRIWSGSTIKITSPKTRRQLTQISAEAQANLLEPQVTSGWSFHNVGSQIIAGQRTIHLAGTRVNTAEEKTPSTSSAATTTPPTSTTKLKNGTFFSMTPVHGGPRLDVWVNATTYLPVREQVIGPFGHVQKVTSYTWLPRTRANLAKLQLQVPHDFVDGSPTTIHH